VRPSGVLRDSRREDRRHPQGKRVATRGDGDFVGEIALLEDTKRTATVTAKTPLRLFVLSRRDSAG
jgi:CRP-like cAMP-binding protein